MIIHSTTLESTSDDIVEEAMRTNEEIEKENVLFIKNLQPVKNYTTPQKRKREKTTEDQKIPEEDNI